MEGNKKSLADKVSSGLKGFKNGTLCYARIFGLLFNPWRYIPKGKFLEEGGIRWDAHSSKEGYRIEITPYNKEREFGKIILGSK